MPETTTQANNTATLPIYGTFANGAPAVRQEDYSAFLAAGGKFNDIPQQLTSSMVILRPGATNIDWQTGMYSFQDSKGGTRYEFIAPNGSYSTGGSKSEAIQKAKDKGYYNVISGAGYSGSVGVGVTPSYTGNAQAGVDNTTNVPDASMPQTDNTALTGSAEFKALPADQQEIVKQVYDLIASNNQEQAQKLAAAFKTSAAISDPFFKQELRLAVDAIERGFVSIDKEEEFKLKQIQNRKADLEQDLMTQKDFLNLEEASALRQIDREFDQQIKATRQTLASRGFSSSSRRVETEQLLEESTGDLRESTNRKFGLQKQEIDRTAERAQRDTASEIARLQEITKENKLDFLRTSESNIGSNNLAGILPKLNTDVNPLGGIVGDLPRQQTEDIIRGAQNLIF